MRLKQTRLRPFLFRPRIVTKNNEGVPEISFGTPHSFQGEIWPATSKRQIEQYGDRISGIQNMRIEGEYDIEVIGATPTAIFGAYSIRPGDGVHVYATEDQEPDYEVLSFTQYNPLKLEVEKRHG